MENTEPVASVSNATSSIRHGTIIQKAQDYHKSNESVVQLKLYGKMIAFAILSMLVGISLHIILQSGFTVTGESLFTILTFFQYMFYVMAGYCIILMFLLITAKTVARMGSWGIFISGLINANASLISFTLICFVFSYYIGLSIPKAVKEPVEEENKSKSDDSSKKEQYIGGGFCNISNFYMAMGMSAGIFLLKNILIYALSYNVHFFYYSERIEKNNNKINLLKILNGLVNAGYSEDIDTISKKLIELISKDSGTITYADAKHVIGEENADSLFYYLNIEKTVGMLECSDLQKFYKKTLFEQEQLSEGLVQKNSSVDNLNVVATFICVILSISTFFSELNREKGSVNQIAIIMTGLATGGYIFADIIKKYIGSLLFVFFIRPFEIGDHVIIDGKISKVKEINILTSTLIQDQLTVICPNSRLIDAAITNLRLSKAYEVTYTFSFNVEEYKSKENALKVKIEEHVSKRSIIFRKHVYFKDPIMLDINTIVVSIVASFNMEDIRIKKLRENQEQFVLDLNAIFREVGLNPGRK
ncbi:hypothetical protein PAEPH01_0633 [Pancytospora epiphaga]|nr:hypothetical protein PAEPH01_0633 [Pancytospora epiphaga]